MSEECVIRHGIKLLKRKCKGIRCINVFWVPRSSPQKFCCKDCMEIAEEKRYRPRYRKFRSKRHVNYELKEDDYE